MARPLVVVAITGIAVSFVCLTFAAAIGGDDLMAFAQREGFDFDPDPAFWSESNRSSGPQVTREFPWTPTEDVNVNVWARVYWQEGMEAKVTVTGSERDLDRLHVEDGTIGLRRRGWRNGSRDRMEIRITGPASRSWTLNGSGHIELTDVKQDDLEINIHGSGSVVANGEVDELELTIAGSGDAQLGMLRANTLDATIAGSGDAEVAPLREADIQIAGSGDIRLLTRPERLETHVAGSGRIEQVAPPENAQSL